MDKTILLFVLNLASLSFTTGKYCDHQDICNSEYYVRETYYTSCSFWTWGRCTRYRSKKMTTTYECSKNRCCPGYTGNDCSSAICFGEITCPNGGYCISPNQCRCTYGFTGPHCQAACSSHDRWCWPGTCGSSHYSSECKCIPNFRREYSTYTAQCQPKKKPEFTSCLVTATAKDGTQAKSFTGSSACTLQNDFYGRFQVDNFQIQLGAVFEIDLDDHIKENRPDFITTEVFGVTGVSIRLYKVSVSSVITNVSYSQLNIDKENPKRQFNADTNVLSNTKVENGERLCLHLVVKGGGYLIPSSVFSTKRNVSYKNTEIDKSICYIYDDLPPSHCSERPICRSEPLKLSTRVTSSRRITLNIDEWNDTSPVQNAKLFYSASGIKSFTIEMYEVTSSTPDLQMRDTSAKGVVNISSTEIGDDFEIELPSKNPMLYALVLEVTDFANNARHARRFVLYDNSSLIKINQKFPLRVTTASSRTNFHWQTNHEKLCFTWTRRYFNDHYKNNNPFRPIIPDKYDITGRYDQIEGVLPVKGTENIHGLNGFFFSLLRNGNEIDSGQVRNFTSESLCTFPEMNDGDKFTLKIQAKDIMNHTLNDSFSVFIDQSPPEINDIWLTRTGHEQLFVHDSTDLSKMSIQFKAFDVHSGIRVIKWAFGTYENNTVLIEKSIGVTTFDNGSNSSTGYCPKIGNCSQLIFEAKLTALVNLNRHRGHHNRRYFFTIEAMNNAFLKAFDHIDILVDNSPPEIGVVLEGSSHDIDYTSNSEVTIHWHDFIDHESGIMMYKVALGNECFKNLEHLSPGLKNDIVVTETVHDSIKLSFPNGEGKYFVSLVAYNNALNPSKVVCSDGVVFDTTYPKITNVALKHAKIRQSVGCLGGEAWLIKENLVKVPLNSSVCFSICKNKTDDVILKIIPSDNTTSDEGSAFSYFICKQVTTYSSQVIYVPTDQLGLSWEITNERSQIDGVFIGFGKDETSIDNPSIMSYTKVVQNNKYNQRHPGLIGEETFYIFIKVTSKAGIYTHVSLGPVLAVEAPPVCSAPIQPVIERQSVIIKWTNIASFNKDQNNEIEKVFFRFGVGTRYIISLFEWNIDNNAEKCDPNEQCIEYPVKGLQKYDSKEGSDFFAVLYFYNYAGHYCSATSLPFSLPSLFPPAPGVVLDVVPSNSFIHEDVDITFESNEYCVSWTGFDHYENIDLEIGLGSLPTTDNVVKFHKIQDIKQKFVCEKNLFNDTSSQKYFVTIKASSSGGTILTSSDGFVNLKESDILSRLLVHYGKDCLVSESIDIIHGGGNTMSFTRSLDVGKIYSILSSASLTVQNDDVVIIKADMFSEHFVTTFLTLKDKNSINATFTVNRTSVTNSTIIKAFRCNPFSRTQLSQRNIPIYWTLDSAYADSVTHFEIALCKYKTEKCEKSLFFLNAGNSTSFNFTGNFQKGTYISFVRPCFGHICLSAASSDVFSVLSPPTEKLDLTAMGTVDGIYLKVNLSIQTYSCGGNRPALAYRWALFTDQDCQHMSSNWKYMAGDNVGTGRQIEDSVALDSTVLPYKHGFIGVEAICDFDADITSCSRMDYLSDPNTFNKGLLYDLNLDDPFIRTVQNYRHSSNVGSNMINLQKHEMDFAVRNVRIGGLIIGRPNLFITWYLTSRHQIPTSLCSLDDACLLSANTTDGFIDFKNPLIKNNQILYICAVSADFKMCSNGFLVDDGYPKPGIVDVDTYNDYVIDGDHLSITWTGFEWNKDALKLGYLSDIAEYKYAIGTYRGADDVRVFTSVGMSTSVEVFGLDLQPGIAYFVAVRAFNHVNKSIDAYSKYVIHDPSPPTSGIIEISNHHGCVAAHTILIRWFGIDDSESGISKIEVVIGSHNNSADAVPYREFVEFAEINGEEHLKDGHNYFAIVRATNRAGLQSYTTSQSFVVDSSPPIFGHVMETSADDNTKDIDFQSDGTEISVSWYGFTDPHSKLKFYKIGLGTSPDDDDVIPFTNVGLKTSTSWQKDFINGVRYYTTVMACNGAELCSTSTSNGVVIDTSPPVPGLVVVGDSGTHSRYQSNRKSVHARWFGFQDPHSGLDHFDVCIGTSNDSCDTVNPVNVQMRSAILIPNMNIAVGTEYFITVSACNNVGMCTKRHSKGFIVDDTAPEVVTKPYISNMHMTRHKNRTFISDPSFIKVFWRFVDNESQIIRSSVSIQGVKDSHTPLDDVVIPGVSEYAVNLPQNKSLRLGDVYTIHVTACNAADLCTTSYSDDVLVDWTPPQIGGFEPPMKYELDRLNQIPTLYLSWYGFSDLQSDIVSYHISIGFNYSTTDIIENYLYLANESGDVENHKIIMTNRSLPDKMVLTIYAVNGAGLPSSESKVTVDIVPSVASKSSGKLIIQKHSCSMAFCNEGCKLCDCTCGVVGQKCSPHIDEICNTNKAYLEQKMFKNPNVTVSIVSTNKGTGSSKCLYSEWVNANSSISILRYDYSFGKSGSEVGEGVYNLSIENPWHDVGKKLNAFYCLPNGELGHGFHYIAYVRTWISPETFVISSSTPIVVDHTPPVLHKRRPIIDATSSCVGDIDYISSYTIIHGCWDGVFSDDESGILEYQVSLGTSKGVDDVVPLASVGLTTSVAWDRFHVEPGTRYYTNVVAINNIGLMTDLSSDGFLLDNDLPTEGVVFNTKHHSDTIYQSGDEPVVFSWHGFDDEHSFINHYEIAFEINSLITNKNSSLPFSNAGNLDRYRYPHQLFHGDVIKAYLRAVDAAGHKSQTVTSESLHIDDTNPESLVCNKYDIISTKYIRDANNLNVVIVEPISSSKNDMLKISIKVSFIEIEFAVYLKIGDMNMILPIIKTNKNTAFITHNHLVEENNVTSVSFELYGVGKNASVYINISKCIDMNITNASEDFILVEQISKDEISVCTQAIDIESGIRKISVGVGSTVDGLEVSAMHLLPLHRHDVIRDNFTHGMAVYVSATIENHAGLSTFIKSNPFIIDMTSPVITEGVVKAVYIHNGITTYTLISAAWTVKDEESAIESCEYCIGSSSKLCDLLEFEPAPTFETFTSSPLRLHHGHAVYVTIVCVNSVHIPGTASFGPLVLSFLPPDSNRSSLRFQTTECNKDKTQNLTISWDSFSDPSAVATYSAQLSSGERRLIDWVNVGKKNYLELFSLGARHPEKFTFNVRAENVGELTSKPVNGTFWTDCRDPILTGSSIELRYLGNYTYRIDFGKVFTAEPSIIKYEVMIGSSEKASDVIMPTTIRSDTIDFLLSKIVSDVYVIVTGYTSSGQFLTYRQSITL